MRFENAEVWNDTQGIEAKDFDVEYINEVLGPGVLSAVALCIISNYSTSFTRS